MPDSTLDPPRSKWTSSPIRRAAFEARRVFGSMSAQSRLGLTSVGWSGMTQVTALGFRFVSSYILARLLLPEAYGLFSMAMAVLTTLDWFADLGIDQAVIRHPEGLTRRYLSTAWWLSLGRAGVLSAITASLAWPLSYFYGKAEVFGILLAMSLLAPLSALRSPAWPSLRRNLDYRSIFMYELCRLSITTVVTVSGAYWLQSVWVFVLGTLLGSAIASALTYFFAPMIPDRCFDRTVFAGLWTLSKQIFFNTMAMAAWQNSDRLLGLKLTSEAEFGIYAVAYQLSSILEHLTLHAFDIHFLILSRMQDEDERLAWHKKMTYHLTRWGMPLACACVLVSPLAIMVIFPPRFAGSAIPFALLNARLLPRMLSTCEFQFLLSSAKIRSATTGYIIAAATQIGMLLTIGNRFGAVGFALSWLASTCVQTAALILLSGVQIRGNKANLAITYAWTVASMAGVFLLWMSGR